MHAPLHEDRTREASFRLFVLVAHLHAVQNNPLEGDEVERADQAQQAHQQYLQR